MPHKIKNAPQHFDGIRPRSRVDRYALVKIAGYVVLAIAAVAALSNLQGHWQQVRELTWNSSPGVVEQVRPVLVSQAHSEGGSVMLYQAQVLVAYQLQGATKERWVTIRQTPRQLADIQLQAFRWKGTTCTIRWNPKAPDQIDAEVG